MADFVLTDLPPRSRAQWGVTLEQAVDAVQTVVLKGFERAQAVLHAP